VQVGLMSLIVIRRHENLNLLAGFAFYIVYMAHGIRVGDHRILIFSAVGVRYRRGLISTERR
jgi:hypothetical protein